MGLRKYETSDVLSGSPKIKGERLDWSITYMMEEEKLKNNRNG